MVSLPPALDIHQFIPYIPARETPEFSRELLSKTWKNGLTYDRVILHNNWDSGIKLRNVIFYLADVAKTWFLNHEAEMITWEIFSLRVREVFRRPEERKARAFRKLSVRSQLASETYTSYIEDVLSLCRRVDASMPESERIRHAIKGIAEQAFVLFQLQPATDTATILSRCQLLEEARLQRIPIASCIAEHNRTHYYPSGEQFRAMIREVVREEVRSYFANSPSPQASGPSAFRDVIREELGRYPVAPVVAPMAAAEQACTDAVQRLRQPATFLSPEGPLAVGSNLATFTPSGFERRPPNQDFRRWRTFDNRPICFYCGIVGHVIRYCQRRHRDEGYHTSNNDSTSYGYRRTYSTRPRAEFSTDDAPPEPWRRPSRQRSPSPYRRRQSISPMTSLPRRTTAAPTEN